MKQSSSRIWGNGGAVELKYGTESDLVGFVKIFLLDMIEAMNLDFVLVNDLSIKHVAPDICVVTDGNRLVGVVEVKKCGPDILIQPTVLGELFDQMLLVEGFYCSGPVIGILTTLEEWVVAWFVADDKHFAAVSCQPSSSLVEETVFLTPSKPTVDSSHDSPPGNTPSQLSTNCHSVEDEEEEEEEEEEEGECIQLPLYAERILSTTQVFNAMQDFEALLQHVYTAFRRMSEVRLYHSLGVPRCLFQVHRDQLGITWHAISSIPIDINNLSAINSSPRGTVKHLLAVEDLGRGSSGKVWLTCTVSKKPSICVLKFHNHNSTGTKLSQEKKKWDMIYPEFQRITSVDIWSGSFALKMPHFCSIPVTARDSFRPLIEEMMRNRFLRIGLVHCDVKWRNIGFYMEKKKAAMGPVPVLYDLESVRSYSHEKDEQWVENAMMQLYKT